MPVTVQVNSHKTERYHFTPKPTSKSFAHAVRAQYDKELSERSYGASSKPRTKKTTKIISTSIQKTDLPNITTTQNGFVHACIAAYNKHYDLVIRPDDIWLAILAQFNFYVNSRTEALRSMFVSHEGKLKLSVVTDSNHWNSDYEWIARAFRELLNENIKDDKFKEWIIPNFTTTTRTDETCGAILMMGTLKAYFHYEMMCICGIPSVTLQGRRSDYVSILHRLEKLSTFGPEAIRWSEMLKPIIRRFIWTFDRPDDQELRDFWNQICHYNSGGCGMSNYTGWLTAFCAFDESGRWQLYDSRQEKAKNTALVLDGVKYQAMGVYSVTWGFCEVDVKINDQGTSVDAAFVAGLIGEKITDSNSIYGQIQSSVSAYPGWFIYKKGSTDTPTPPKKQLPKLVQDEPTELPYGNVSTEGILVEPEPIIVQTPSPIQPDRRSFAYYPSPPPTTIPSEIDLAPWSPTPSHTRPVSYNSIASTTYPSETWGWNPFEMKEHSANSGPPIPIDRNYTKSPQPKRRLSLSWKGTVATLFGSSSNTRSEVGGVRRPRRG